jgi:hypothetical protein
MHQSNTLYVGMDVHKESIAVAYVAHEYGAEVVLSGPSAPASVTSTGLSGSCTRRANTWSLSMKRDSVRTGSIADWRKKAISVGSSRPCAESRKCVLCSASLLARL